MTLAEYVLNHSRRGECRCGSCSDVGNKPDPVGHAADMIFFPVVGTNSPIVEEFVTRTKAHVGEFCEVNPLDGQEHSYLELGGWLGDQGLALQYMGLGTVLGVFDLLTPRTLFPPDMVSEDQIMKMATNGVVAVTKKD